MYDMPLRDYDPAIGRWVVLDPVVHHSQSTYSGFNGNPVVFADPSGGAGQQMLDRRYEDHEPKESSFFPDNSYLFEGEDSYDGGGANSEFGVFEEGSGFEVCPTCPNTKEFDRYHNDTTTTYYYDPESGLVSIHLDEVVIDVKGKDFFDYLFDYYESTENHFNGFKDILVNGLVGNFKSIYNRHYDKFDRKYYNIYKRLKKNSILPPPGKVRQYLKKIFSNSKFSSSSKLLKRVGIVGNVLTGSIIAKDFV